MQLYKYMYNYKLFLRIYCIIIRFVYNIVIEQKKQITGVKECQV